MELHARLNTANPACQDLTEAVAACEATPIAVRLGAAVWEKMFQTRCAHFCLYQDFASYAQLFRATEKEAGCKSRQLPCFHCDGAILLMNFGHCLCGRREVASCFCDFPILLLLFHSCPRHFLRGHTQVARLKESLSAEDFGDLVVLEFEERLNSYLSNFPAQDVAKAESDHRKQAQSFCQAVVAEQQHPDSELSTACAEVASMAADLLSLGDVVALQRGAAALEKLGKEQSNSSVVLFFSKHNFHCGQGGGCFTQRLFDVDSGSALHHDLC